MTNHKHHYIVQLSLHIVCPQRLKYCRSFDHRTVSLTWWPIKSNVQQPLLSFMVTFDINHSHQGSAVRFQSAGFLWSLPRTPQQNRPLYITASLGGLLLDTRASLPEWKKTSSSCNTTGGLFNGVPQSTSSKGAKPASGLYFCEKGENYVDFGVSIVSLHHTSEGSSDFYWAYGWQFDFDGVLLTLKLTSAICLQKKVATRQGGMCSMCRIYRVVPNWVSRDCCNWRMD